MSDLHQLQVSALDRSTIENVDPKFIVEGLFRARNKTVEVLHEIRKEFKEGLSENDARSLALSIFKDHGVTKHWHRPYIRFGEGTLLSFYDPISENRLALNDIYHLDLGPVWPSEKLGLDSELEYEGDYGDTFVFGDSNQEAVNMIDALHEVFYLAKNEWQNNQLAGTEIYRFFNEQISKRGFVFIEKVDGHRVSDFPHHKYTKDRLSKIDFTPSNSLWILEAMICHPTLKMGAFFEDLMSDK
jgi:methionine aminopeptidase